jgi:hypothetical protein
VYTGPFTVSSTATVKFFSTDVAGNAEAVKSQVVQIDAASPTVSITNPTNNSSFKWGTKITVSASAADQGTGTGVASGIAQVAFRIDGKASGTDTSLPYTTSWTPKKNDVGTHTIVAVATDVAGNTTTSVLITVIVTN